MNIVVVGAGISGLTAAFRVRQAGHTVHVLEAASHPGGRMWTTTALGLDIDTGAHMLLDSYERTRALATEVGLGDRWTELPDGAEGGVVHDRELASFSPGGPGDVLRYRGLSFEARIRLFLTLLEARTWQHQVDFFDLSVGSDSFDTEDCETFARRHVGDEATAYLVDAFIRTFHFHGANKMSAKYFEALAALLLSRGRFRLCALRGHMRSLPSALAAKLPVRYGVEVRSVSALSGGGVDVEWPDGSARCDAAVVATTAEVARALLKTPTAAQMHVLERAVSSRTILCAYSVAIEHAKAFEGAWIPFCESRLVSGVSNDLCEPLDSGARRVLSVWLHEEGADDLFEVEDGAVSRIVAGEVGRLIPRFDGHLTSLSVERLPRAIPVYGTGQVTRVKDFWNKGQGEGGVWLCGDYLNHPWVEGAVRCGEKIAERLSSNHSVQREHFGLVGKEQP